MYSFSRARFDRSKIRHTYSLEADWLVFLTYYWKSVERQNELAMAGMVAEDAAGTGLAEASNATEASYNASFSDEDLPWNEQLMSWWSVRFAGLYYYCLGAFIVSYLFFFGIGGYLHVSDFPKKKGKVWHPLSSELGREVQAEQTLRCVRLTTGQSWRGNSWQENVNSREYEGGTVPHTSRIHWDG